VPVAAGLLLKENLAMDFSEEDRLAVNRAAEEISEELTRESSIKWVECGWKYDLKGRLLPMALANAYLCVAAGLHATAYDLDMADLGRRFNEVIKDALRDTP